MALKNKKSYLPKYASGEIIGAFCLTEPDVGSDASAVKTTAINQGNEYIINGTKRYITNAPRTGTFTVMARTDPSIKGAKGISAFIVDASTPGITLGPKDKKWISKALIPVMLFLRIAVSRPKILLVVLQAKAL
jgi:acyl-CoA dehydrogenase